MNDTISCCGTCKYAFGTGTALDCGKTFTKVTQYEGCLMYEPKEEANNEKKLDQR